MAEQKFKVKIHVYDLTQGMARQFSPMFLGKQIDGIWHTGMVVYGKEYYYGGGICKGKPKQTPYGFPTQEIDMGETEIPQEMFHEYLKEISPKFSMDKYDLFENNCNNFTNECCEFLIGEPLPKFIIGLPQDVLQTPLGQMIKPFIDNITKSLQSESGQTQMFPQMYEGLNNTDMMNFNQNNNVQAQNPINVQQQQVQQVAQQQNQQQNQQQQQIQLQQNKTSEEQKQQSDSQNPSNSKQEETVSPKQNQMKILNKTFKAFNPNYKEFFLHKSGNLDFPLAKIKLYINENSQIDKTDIKLQVFDQFSQQKNLIGFSNNEQTNLLQFIVEQILFINNTQGQQQVNLIPFIDLLRDLVLTQETNSLFCEKLLDNLVPNPFLKNFQNLVKPVQILIIRLLTNIMTNQKGTSIILNNFNDGSILEHLKQFLMKSLNDRTSIHAVAAFIQNILLNSQKNDELSDINIEIQKSLFDLLLIILRSEEISDDNANIALLNCFLFTAYKNQDVINFLNQNSTLGLVQKKTKNTVNEKLVFLVNDLRIVLS